jgi:serine/threonine protein kinase
LARPHALRILLNDVKGDNMVIGAEGEVKLIDFGLSIQLRIRKIEPFKKRKKLSNVRWVR